jgi:DNA repair exonuclease SbcCD ATPase subunit
MIPQYEESLKVSRDREKVVTAELNASRGEIAGLRSTIAGVSQILSVRGEACPSCGQSIPPAAREFAQGKVDELTPQVTALEQALPSVQTALQSLQQAIRSNEATLQGLRTQAADLPEGDAVKDTMEEHNRLAVLQQDKVAKESKVQHLSDRVKAGAAAAKAVESLKMRIDVTAEQVNGMIDSAMTLMQETNCPLAEIDEKLKQVRAEAAANRELETTLARIEGRLGQLSTSVNNAEASLSILTEQQDKQSHYRQVMETLKRVREWFHYANGPKKIINNLLEEITAVTNDFLTKFGSPFTVKPDFEKMSFRYQYLDDRVTPEGWAPAEDLSGGEKIVLAVSFRFASYCMFASRTGFLTLDEPTVYLDDKNIGNFCSMLERMKEVAASMDLQIAISTHERRLYPFFDTVVDLNEETVLVDE